MELNELEQRLVDCLRAGKMLNLVPHFGESESIDPVIVSSWSTRYEIRASVIREILCGNLVDPSAVDPRGMMIRGAKISGRLDLADLECAYPLELTACYLPLGLNADSASFVRLSLEQCVVGTKISTSDAHAVQGAVRLVGARVGGQLILNGAVLSNTVWPALYADGLVVEGDVFLDESFRASSESSRGTVRLLGAKIGGQLSFQDAVLSNTTGPALFADGLVVQGGMFLNGSFHASGEGARGAVRLVGAKVGVQLTLNGAVLSNTTGSALYADGLVVEGNMFLEGSFRASGESTGGTVSLEGIKVSGMLSLQGAVLLNTVGPALYADRLKVDGTVSLRSASFKVSGSDPDTVVLGGAVRLGGAKIGSVLILRDAVLSNSIGSALYAHGLAVESNMLLDRAFLASSEGARAAVDISGAKVGGQLSFRGAVLSNTVGSALYADGLVVEGNVSLDGSFRASSQGDDGAVRLVGARVGGQLTLNGAVLSNTTGPALFADGLVVEGDMLMGSSFRASSESSSGTVRVVDTRIGGLLSFRDAVLSNTVGPALSADRAAVNGNMFLDGSFRASSGSSSGTVRLLGARVGGQLTLNDAVLSNTTGPALDLYGAVVETDMFLTGAFCASSEGRRGAVWLENVKVGYLHISDEVFRESSQQHKWAMDGLTYGGYATKHPETWLKALKNHTVGYAAQPYQHLARAVRDAGHDGAARKILITQRSDQLRRGEPGWKDWCWGAFTWVTVGYGYRSWLPLAWFVGVFFLVWWAVVGIYPEGLATVSELQKAGADPQCSSLEKFQVALDMVSPLTSTGVEKTCKILIRDSAGEALTRISMLARVAGWALITLFVAGFTGIIRKS